MERAHPLLCWRASDKEDAKVVCCASDLEMARSVPFCVKEGDRVLEIGCQGGATTQALSKAVGAAGLLVGMDMASRKGQWVGGVKQARDGRGRGAEAGAKGAAEEGSSGVAPAQGGNAPVQGGEAAVEGGVRRMLFAEDAAGMVQLLKLEESFTVIYVDLTILLGNDLLLDTLSRLVMLDGLFGRDIKLLVFKSRALNELASILVPAATVTNNGEPWALAQRIPRASWVCSVGVSEYRSVISSVVRPGDRVLELGCHLGTSTKLLADAAGAEGSAVGVDIGGDVISQARKRYPELTFHVGDAYDTHALARMEGAEGGYDVIFVDVGGLSSSSGLLEAVSLLRQLACAFGVKLRTIVIKSACMRAHARRCVVGHRMLRGTTKQAGDAQ